KMEEENARLQATIEENNKKIASLNAQVAELNTQISTLNSEKQSLQEQLDKKPTGHATTIIPGEKTETQQATDPKEAAKSYQTSVDEEVARIKTRNSQLLQE